MTAGAGAAQYLWHCLQVFLKPKVLFGSFQNDQVQRGRSWLYSLPWQAHVNLLSAADEWA